jgi:dipeptidyl aminopeptidase/acylaminoacyl peptidase
MNVRATPLAFEALAALLLNPVYVSAGPIEFSRDVKCPDPAQVLTSAAWSPDGRLLAAAGEAPSVFVWETAGHKLIQRLDGGAKGLASGSRHSVAFSPDGKFLAAGIRSVRLWDTATWRQTRELDGPGINPGVPQPIGVQSLMFTPDGQSLVVSYNELPPRSSPVVAFGLNDGAVQWSYELHSQLDHPRILPPLINLPDRHEMGFASGQMNFGGRTDLIRSTAIIFLDPTKGTETRRIERIHSEAPTALAISRDEKLLATASRYGSSSNGVRDTDPIRIWDAATGQDVHELPITAGVRTLAFTPDGRYLIASQTESPGHNALKVWRVDSWTEVKTVDLAAAQTVWGLSFSPDGRQLAAVGPYEVALFQVAPN